VGHKRQELDGPDLPSERGGNHEQELRQRRVDARERPVVDVGPEVIAEVREPRILGGEQVGIEPFQPEPALPKVAIEVV
jgi:hypothetical protein